jgi:hypothetical protein
MRPLKGVRQWAILGDYSCIGGQKLYHITIYWEETKQKPVSTETQKPSRTVQDIHLENLLAMT